ncbi:hypothetical protein BN946_scf184872.g5 [Trametes cinnabarina]|uniref:Uncharacterized protein n=1 Tax=Pycnoporus cinnabarinus TaxID=5643 RepID=A0A060SDL5_PYCCI|nr:hypothetical protein BN946_scf184872.g5 [Trametes cinnabarina]
MEYSGSFIAASPSDFLEGSSSPRRAPSLDDYAFSFSYYLDREDAGADPQRAGIDASSPEPDNYASTSNALGFVLQTLSYPHLPSLSYASCTSIPPAPLKCDIPPSKKPADPPVTVCPHDFFSPPSSDNLLSSVPSTSPVSVMPSSSSVAASASSASSFSSDVASSFACAFSSSAVASSSAAIASSSSSSSYAASVIASSTQHVFVAGISSGADVECSPAGMEYSEDMPAISDSSVTADAVPPTLQLQTLRRSTRQAASSQAAAPSAKQRPVPSTKKAKTSESKKSFAKPTQPVASGSAMPQAGPSGTKEVPQRAPKRAIEDVDTAEDEPAPKKKKPRALRRTWSEVDVFKIPTDPCDCPVQGCGLEFGNSRYDNVAHLKQHYGQNGLRYAKVDCLWPGCNVQVPGNTLIDHV